MNNSDSTKFDQPGIALNVVSFLCPPFGFVSYFMSRHNRPKRARRAGQFALFGAWLIFVVYVNFFLTGSGEPSILIYATICWLGAMFDSIGITLYRRNHRR